MREVIASVLENVRLTKDIYSLTFACDEKIKVRPGQFAMIGVAGFPLRRPLAICKSEGERFTVCYRVKGEGTRRLSLDYKTGEKLSVLLPLGNGFFVEETEKKVAVVGGGAGIFPLISAIREYASTKEVYAYMGFASESAVCMEYEMQRAKSLTIATDDGSAGFHGTAVQALLKEINDVKPDVILSCGPVPMLRALKCAVGGKDIPTYVSLEERMGCGVGACLVCVCNTTDGRHARVCKDGPVFEISKISL